jgi:hypothetical protein
MGIVDGGVAAARIQARSASQHVRAQVKQHGNGYRMPPGQYWSKFREAFYVFEAERAEWLRIAGDAAAMERLEKIKNFPPTTEIRQAYETYLQQALSKNKAKKFEQQKKELELIANQEQIIILQPLIYDDEKLKATLDRTAFVTQIAKDFNDLMTRKKSYMDAQLAEIRKWINA